MAATRRTKSRKRCVTCGAFLDDKDKCPKIYYDHSTRIWKHE